MGLGLRMKLINIWGLYLSGNLSGAGLEGWSGHGLTSRLTFKFIDNHTHSITVLT